MPAGWRLLQLRAPIHIIKYIGRKITCASHGLKAP